MNDPVKPLPAQAIQLYAYPAAPDDADEISLFDLWRLLVQRKRLLAGIILAAVVLSGSYAAIAPVWYRTEIHLLPPSLQDVEILDDRGISLASMQIIDLGSRLRSPDSLYQEFQNNLESRAARREFFDRNPILLAWQAMAEDEVQRQALFESGFDQRLQLIVPKSKGESNRVKMSFDYAQAAEAAEVLNQFVADMNQKTLDAYAADIESALTARINSLRAVIQRKRDTAQAILTDRLTQLREAAKVAAQLGIQQRVDTAAPFLPKDLGGAVVENRLFGQRVTEVLTFGDIPLYLRGEKALQAEMDALQARATIDPFIPELRELQEQLNALEKVRIKRDNLRAVRIDQAALVPQAPASLRWWLIMVIGALAGIFLGVLSALLAHFFSTHSHYVAAESSAKE